MKPQGNSPIITLMRKLCAQRLYCEWGSGWPPLFFTLVIRGDGDGVGVEPEPKV